MNSSLGDIHFLSLLPESIREDQQLAAAASSLDDLLRRTTVAIPNLLLWARLDRSRQAYLPPLARLIEAAGGLKALSPELLELLAWQLHVDFREVAITPAQLEGMVKNSIPWHRIKGTPGSVKDALGLFDLRAELEEDGEGDYWATYQIGLPSIADLETVKLVCRVAYEMHPARCSLYRIYTDVWDVRPGVYDDGRYDEAAYDYYSGVDVPGLPDGGDLIVSFGRLTSAQSMPEMRRLLTGRGRLHSATAADDDDMSYDVARYDHTLMTANHGFSRSRLRSLVIGRPVYRRHGWSGSWDGRRWAELASISHEREPFTFCHRSVAVIEALYDDSNYDGGPCGQGGQDAFYGQPVFTLADAVPAYDDDAYDDNDPQRRTMVVDEMVRHARGTQSFDPLLPQNAGIGIRHQRFGEHQAQTIPLLPRPPGWNGGWNSRRWRAGGAQSNLTREVTA
jgi:hypothetical protein